MIQCVEYFGALFRPFTYMNLFFNLKQMCIEYTGGRLILIIKGLDPLYMENHGLCCFHAYVLSFRHQNEMENETCFHRGA